MIPVRFLTKIPVWFLYARRVDNLPPDWETQVARAYTVFGVDPLDEFAWFGGRLDPGFLRRKAEDQLRDIKGRFREMRGRIGQQKYTDDDWLPDPFREMPKRGTTRLKPRTRGLPPLPSSQVTSLTGPSARDALVRAGFKDKLADFYSTRGTVHTADDRTFAWTPSRQHVREKLTELIGPGDPRGVHPDIDRLWDNVDNTHVDARYALARMRDLERLAPGAVPDGPFMVEFDDVSLARAGAHGMVNGVTDHNRLKLRTGMHGMTLGEFQKQDRKVSGMPSRWEKGREWAEDVDALMYILTHEMGHIADKRIFVPGSSGGPINSRWHKKIKESEGMSAYAQSRAVEGYAEAFARYVLAGSKGQPIPAIIQQYAEKFGWDEILYGGKR